MRRLKYRKKKIIRAITATLLVACLVVLPKGSTSYADNDNLTNDYIEEKQNQVQQLQQEKNDLQAGIDSAKQLLANLQSKKNNLASYVQEMDAALGDLESKITDMNAQIEQKEADIEETKQELADAQAEEQAQYEAMKVRIRFMFEEGNAYYLEMLFSSTGFADMLNKADYIEEISEYDRKKLEEYILNAQLIAACQEELEAQQELLQTQKETLEEEQAAKEALVADAESNILEMQVDINDTAALKAQLDAEYAAQTSTIQALEAQIAAEKKRLQEANQPQQTYDGGQFCWPCPSYSYISSPYGWRKHPILGTQRYHSGVDLAAPAGSPILAAYDGTVVAASYSSAMGNYIMIDHGDGLSTIYMHASALYVSEGQQVVRGEKIAAVGTTGLSTGNHLHFTVRLNGEYVDPMPYIQ